MYHLLHFYFFFFNAAATTEIYTLSLHDALPILPGFVHLYIGQEAVAVGACAPLRPDDYITSTHRGHGHVIAKGGDRSEEHTSELQSRLHLVCRLLLEKKKQQKRRLSPIHTPRHT